MQKKILQDYLFGSWFQNLDKNTSEKIRDVDQETSILKSNIILPVFSIISDILIILIMLIFLFFHIDFETLLIVFVAGVICFLFFVFNKKRITNYGKFRRKYEKKRFEKKSFSIKFPPTKPAPPVTTIILLIILLNLFN